jgi:hypothetical protein
MWCSAPFTVIPYSYVINPSHIFDFNQMHQISLLVFSSHVKKNAPTSGAASGRSTPCLPPHRTNPILLLPPPPLGRAQLGGADSERARELGVVAEQNFRCRRGERNFEKIRLCGGRSLDGGNTCGIAEEGTSRRRSEGRGREAGHCTCATGRHTKMVRVEDAGDGAACKRQGETIAKGHKNYELMLNLQLGIR